MVVPRRHTESLCRTEAGQLLETNSDFHNEELPMLFPTGAPEAPRDRLGLRSEFRSSSQKLSSWGRVRLGGMSCRGTPVRMATPSRATWTSTASRASDQTRRPPESWRARRF